MYDVSPYEVLGVARTATAKEIRQAYIAHLKINHPNKDTDPSAVTKSLLLINGHI
jgi:curved DNA-binding protein CbpA